MAVSTKLVIRLSALMLFTCSLFLGGCSSSTKELPKTYPVKGKIIRADGKAATGGVVEFRCDGQPFIAIGIIQKDGTFQLSTNMGDARLTGAVEGIHKVIINPDMSGSQQSSDQPIVLNKSYTVKATQDNQFEIRLP